MAFTMRKTEQPIRELTADDLGIGAAKAIEEHGSSRPDDPPLPDDDPMLVRVRDLLERYGGVIFSGPPGTSKTYYAQKIALKLVNNDKTRVRYVQFHPSYQYEDFMQGFVPDKSGTGFTFADKHFVAMCREAGKPENSDKRYVLVIDELSRGDPGRVFGEALTYVEKSKRGLELTLASGEDFVVPANLTVLATMNPLDRGVDEVDAAFERRFAKIAMDPDRDILRELLERNRVDDPLRARIVGFFDKTNGRARLNPLASVGHTFFMDVTDAQSLQSLWDHQLQFLFEKAYRLDEDTRKEIEQDFQAVLRDEQSVGESAQGPPAPPPREVVNGSQDPPASDSGEGG